MSKACRLCGERIEFRYYNGAVRPLGCRCSSGTQQEGTLYRMPPRLDASYETFECYLSPNAQCPVCGKAVFYYENAFGSKVYFDDVGWPWPKHPCTDTRGSGLKTQRPVQRQHASGRSILMSAEGRLVDIFLVATIWAACTRLRFGVFRATPGKSDTGAILRVVPKVGRHVHFYAEAVSLAPALLIDRDDIGRRKFRCRFLDPKRGRVSSLVLEAERWV